MTIRYLHANDTASDAKSKPGIEIMATFAQAIESANTVLKSAAVASVNIEFMSIAGVQMSATVTRTGLENVKPLN